MQRLWTACVERGDLYRKSYAGMYCVGCEAYYLSDELVEGRCPEHGTALELVEEDNYYFRLSHYADQLDELISTDRLQIQPASRKREVLAFIRSGLEDFSVSRSTARARGWGIPVPGDSDQVIYVWFDALGNYITAPGYGTDELSFRYWWTEADERVHVIGKGIIRFHAVYWPAMLISAGITLPDRILVHEYLTAGGQKISKSAGNAEDPAEIAAQYGTDALRWWLLRDVARNGDTDYTPQRLVDRANADLANTIGNLVNRVVSMVHRYRAGKAPAGGKGGHPPGAGSLRRARDVAGPTIDTALAAFDFRNAAAAVVAIAEEANRFIEATTPWKLAKAEGAGAAPEALDALLAELVAACRDLAEHLVPLLPGAAVRIRAQCGNGGTTVAAPEPVFPRLELA